MCFPPSSSSSSSNPTYINRQRGSSSRRRSYSYTVYASASSASASSRGAAPVVAQPSTWQNQRSLLFSQQVHPSPAASAYLPVQTQNANFTRLQPARRRAASEAHIAQQQHPSTHPEIPYAPRRHRFPHPHHRDPYMSSSDDWWLYGPPPLNYARSPYARIPLPPITPEEEQRWAGYEYEYEQYVEDSETEIADANTMTMTMAAAYARTHASTSTDTYSCTPSDAGGSGGGMSHSMTTRNGHITGNLSAAHGNHLRRRHSRRSTRQGGGIEGEEDVPVYSTSRHYSPGGQPSLSRTGSFDAPHKQALRRARE